MNLRSARPALAAFCLAFAAAQAFAAEPAEPSPQLLQEITASLQKTGGTVFPVGRANSAANAAHFTGKSFVAGLGGDANLRVANVTFEPGSINWWHVHPKSCQVLSAVSGRGYVQIWGEAPVELKPGVTFTVPANTKHWHGAAKDSWFQHAAAMTPSNTVWIEPVDQAEYAKLP